MYRKKLTWKGDLRKMETYIKRIFIKNHIQKQEIHREET